MKHTSIDPLIELIYEAAIEPSRWTDLLNSLAEFVAHIDQSSASGESQLLAVIPEIAAVSGAPPRSTISEALRSLTDVSVAANDSSKYDMADVNDILIRHFARAIKIAKRLVDMGDQHEVVLSLLDRLPIALVLVDEAARVIECNTLADDILTSGTGLRIKDGCLDADVANQQKLLNAVEAMSKHDPATTRGQALSLNQKLTSNNLMLFLAPVKHNGAAKSASVAIFIAQRKSQPFSLPPELAEIYHLTEKEIQITGQLVRGMNIKEISEAFSVSQHTVRSQVKAILRKTETSRQAELVSLVFNGMGAFVNAIPDVAAGQRKGVLSKNSLQQHLYQTIELDDGRHLAYQEYGDPCGELVVHCHSVVGSRLELAFNADEICKQKKIRLINIDRPGFGMSDPDPAASYIKWTNDFVQLIDALEIEQVSLTGYAMGGQYALACAHEAPERIKKVFTISAGMPAISAKDFGQMIPLYKMNTKLARYLPKVYSLLSSVLVKGILNDPDAFFTQLSEKVAAADQRIMCSDDFKREHFNSLREGFRQGGKATSKEIIQLMHDWGFKPDNIKVPVTLWHGDSDHHVPLVLCRRFEEHITETRYHICEGQGHYMFYTHWAKILDELLKV